MITVVLLSILSWGALGALVWKGREPERWAALAFLIAMVGTPLVEAWTIGGVRIGVAALAVALAVSLIALSLAAERWWLLAAGGVQLVSLATYVLAAVQPDLQVWAAVSIRMMVWVQLMLAALFGVVEARRAPYARPIFLNSRAGSPRPGEFHV